MRPTLARVTNVNWAFSSDSASVGSPRNLFCQGSGVGGTSEMHTSLQAGRRAAGTHGMSIPAGVGVMVQHLRGSRCRHKPGPRLLNLMKSQQMQTLCVADLLRYQRYGEVNKHIPCTFLPAGWPAYPQCALTLRVHPGVGCAHPLHGRPARSAPLRTSCRQPAWHHSSRPHYTACMHSRSWLPELS
jgi:hypothetical protein